MDKKFCDVCGKECKHQGIFSADISETVFVRVKVEPRRLVIKGRAENLTADVCGDCIIKTIEKDSKK